MKIPYLIILLLLFGCVTETPVEPERPKVEGVDVKYCEGLGYEYNYLKEGDRRVGYCIFPDGNRCKSFEFVMGECGREYTLCEIKGYDLRIGVEQRGGVNITYAICIFPDNSFCKEVEFFNRKCHVTW